MRLTITILYAKNPWPRRSHTLSVQQMHTQFDYYKDSPTALDVKAKEDPSEDHLILPHPEIPS